MSDLLNNDTTANSETIIISLHYWLKQNNFDQLASLLIEYGDTLELSIPNSIVQKALVALPKVWYENHPGLLVLRAQLKVQTGDNLEAIQLYEQASQDDPS